MPRKAKKNVDADAPTPGATPELEHPAGETAAESDLPVPTPARKKRAKKAGDVQAPDAALTTGGTEGAADPAGHPAEDAQAEVVAQAADTFDQAIDGTQPVVLEPEPVPAPKKRAARKKKTVSASAETAAETVAAPEPTSEPVPAPAPAEHGEPRPGEGGELAAGRESGSGPTEEAAEESGHAQPQAPARLERLQKILAAAGIASRRHAEELITQGRVQVNGKVVTTLGSKADPARDHIRVDGKLLQGAERLRYFALNKPRGYVTTVSDPEGRPTVMEFFSKTGQRLYPVGRLDYQSEGLLLMTNDGELANKLTRAASGVEKTYLVKVSGQPQEELLDRLRGGVSIDRGRAGEGRVPTAPAQIRQVRAGENPWFEVVLIEGRNRELRKMFEEIGHYVEKIRRVGYGPLVLDLEPGQTRELDAEELKLLRLAAEGKWKPKRIKASAMLPKEAGRKVDHEAGMKGGRRPFRQGGARRDDRGPGREPGRDRSRGPVFGRDRGAERPGGRQGSMGATTSGFKPREERPRRDDRPQRAGGVRPVAGQREFGADRKGFEKRRFPERPPDRDRVQGERPAPRGEFRGEGDRASRGRGERPAGGERGGGGGGQRFGDRPARAGGDRFRGNRAGGERRGSGQVSGRGSGERPRQGSGERPRQDSGERGGWLGKPQRKEGNAPRRDAGSTFGGLAGGQAGGGGRGPARGSDSGASRQGAGRSSFGSKGHGRQGMSGSRGQRPDRRRDGRGPRDRRSPR